jgi:hypothetical protein
VALFFLIYLGHSGEKKLEKMREKKERRNFYMPA